MKNGKYVIKATVGECGVYNTIELGYADNQEQASDRCAEIRAETGWNAFYVECDE